MPPLTRRELIGGGLAAASLYAAGGRVSAGANRPEGARWLLWYRRPARYWVEALPVGNGRLGAMVFGGTNRERLQLNEDTLWAGGPYDPSRPEACAALPDVRRLIREGHYREAQELAEADLMARPLRQMPYQTLGDLRIESPGREEPVENYCRWLDLERALAVTRWTAGGSTVHRSVYIDATGGVAVIDYAIEGEPTDLVVALSAGGGRVHGDELWLEGANRAQDGNPGRLRYVLAVKAVAEGADVHPEDGGLRIAGARSVTLLVAAHTSYRDWRHVDADPAAAVRADLDRAAAPDREARLERHLAAHRRLFGGFDIELGDDPFPDLPTDDRIRYSHQRGDDPYLAALYVQYARYLLIASSRPGTQA
ncbi:MAG TPA: glycoside hydrolase family 95 protein, partial [Woeseiaceae bacterium]|nr:glycoside hydrolase family 95 protein [Woeseiaceae bacterium]